MVIHGLYIGGAERRLLAVLAGLDRARFDPLIVCTDELGALAGEARELGVEPIVLGRSRRRDVSGVRRLTRILRTEHVAIVHGWLQLPSVFARAAGALARVPVRISFESASITTMDARRARQYELVERVLAPLTDAYVANSEAVAASLRRRGIAAAKIVVIYNGVAVPAPLDGEERARLRAGLGVGEGTQLVGMVARLDDEFKDHETFLRSVADLVVEGRTVHAAVVGDGVARATLEQLAADLGIADQVTFTGFRGDAAQLVAAFDVSVLLSYSEGFSNVVLETMAAGVPLVATDIPPNREAFEHEVAGLCVPMRSVEATAAALRRLLDHPELSARLGEAARRRAREQFSLEAQAASTMRLYDDLLERKGGRGHA